MSKKNHTTPTRIRTALLAALQHEVTELVRQEHIGALLETLNGTHFDSVRADFTSRGIGRAIMALAPLLDDNEDLACVVHTAAYLRHLGTRDLTGDTPTERMARDLAEHRAYATIDRAGPYVLARFLLRMNEGDQHELEAAPASAEVH